MSVNNNNALDTALNVFNNRIHDFLQGCMRKAGFDSSHLEGSSPTYLHFLSILLSMKYGCSSDVLSREDNPSKKLKKFHEYKCKDIDESKLFSSLTQFSINYESFLSNILANSNKTIDQNILRYLAFEAEMERFEELLKINSRLKAEPQEITSSETKVSYTAESKDTSENHHLQPQPSTLRFKGNPGV